VTNDNLLKWTLNHMTHCTITVLYAPIYLQVLELLFSSFPYKSYPLSKSPHTVKAQGSHQATEPIRSFSPRIALILDVAPSRPISGHPFLLSNMSQSINTQPPTSEADRMVYSSPVPTNRPTSTARAPQESTSFLSLPPPNSAQ
jgi:hypothetical protein